VTSSRDIAKSRGCAGESTGLIASRRALRSTSAPEQRMAQDYLAVWSNMSRRWVALLEGKGVDLRAAV
jgi:hypothetical protein